MNPTRTITKQVNVFQVTEHCNGLNCEIYTERSKLKFTGTVITCLPQKYAHVCPECGEEYNLEQISPYLKYEEVDEHQHD